VAHLTSPTSFREGKTFLHSSLNSNLDNIGFAGGLEQSLDNYLRSHNFLLVRASVANNEQSGSLNMHLLYYPIMRPEVRAKPFPRFSDYYQLINFKFNYSPNFRPTLGRLMQLKQNEFNIRHLTSRPKLNLNKWALSQMFRGPVSFLARKRDRKGFFAKNRRSRHPYHVTKIKRSFEASMSE